MIDTNQALLKDLKTIYQILLLSKNIELLKNLQKLFYYIYILAIYHKKEKNQSKKTTNFKC